MQKVLGYSDVLREIPKSILAGKMRDADFLCDQCGAPMKINWEIHRVMFGDFEDKEREMSCEYCSSVYKINPHEFYAYYRNKS